MTRYTIALIRWGLFFALSNIASGAEYQSSNFHVVADTAEFAQAVANTAEEARSTQCEEWTGHQMPEWTSRCSISVSAGTMGAGGATSFAFDNGEVFGWRMKVQGSRERILDSVVPHEVTHTVLATVFRRPIPRWADEGAATLCEHRAERQRHYDELRTLINGREFMPLSRLFAITEYPNNGREVAILYSEGAVLTDYLIRVGGRRVFLSMLQDSHHRGWPAALHTAYGFNGVMDCETRFKRWVAAGYPEFEPVRTAMQYQCTPQGCYPIGRPYGLAIQSPIDPKIIIRPPVVPVYPLQPPTRPQPRPEPRTPEPFVDYDQLADAVMARIRAEADTFRGPAGSNGANGERGQQGPPGTITIVIQRDGKVLHTVPHVGAGQTVTVPLETVENQ